MRKCQSSADSNVTTLFAEFVKKEHSSIFKILSPKSKIKKAKKFFVLDVTFPAICDYSSHLSQQLLSEPQKTLAIFDSALALAFQQFSENLPQPNRCIVRISSLPRIPEVLRSSIPRSEEVGRFFALQCTVTRVGPIQVVQLKRSFCCAKCGCVIEVHADFNQFYAIAPPKRCTNAVNACSSTVFNTVLSKDSSLLQSCQEIRVNEHFTCLGVGKMARSICAFLSDDLVDRVRPGDDIILNGVLMHRWRSPRMGFPCEIETVFFANYIENLSDLRLRGELGSGNNLSREMSTRFQIYWSSAQGDFEKCIKLRDHIIRNICPDVYGLYFVKLSLALLLVGAPPCFDLPVEGGDPCEHRDTNEFRVRGSLHVLLAGEPSTAKSALLHSSCRLAGRAILTAATGTTAAGLTAAAIRDSSGWSLEAGALVLADGGVCAIDEFASLRGGDRAAVHEAMEQQTISLAKAGLVTRLNCRCAVLAASSLPGGGEQGDLLPTPLLSRFDLVWRLFDPGDCVAWDSAVAGFVLGFPRDDDSSTASALQWTTDELRQYISWVRVEFQPHLSSGAAILLQRYYELRRRILHRVQGAEQEQAIAGRTTLRLLESLVRLSQAHARLMARNTVCGEDAVMAIWLMECSLQSNFGRCASAIEINSHCITPEETVTRVGMDNSFSIIIPAVLQHLGLRREEVDPDWFDSNDEIRSTISPTTEPICTSTQVTAANMALSDSRKVPPKPWMGASEGSKQKYGAGYDNSDYNAFDFDVDSFMPSGGLLEESKTAAEWSSTPFSGKNRPPSPQMEPLLAKPAVVAPGTEQHGGSGSLATRTELTDISNYNRLRLSGTLSGKTVCSQVDPHARRQEKQPVSSQMDTSSLGAGVETKSPPPTCSESGMFEANVSANPNQTACSTKNAASEILGKRMRSKLAKFAFHEPDEPENTKDESLNKRKQQATPWKHCNGSPEKTKRSPPSAPLTFANMTPDEWRLDNIDIDI